MFSFNKYNKTKRSHNNNDDSKNNKNIDTSYPTITVIDPEGKNVFIDDDEPRCLFLSERTYVIMVLSLYTFFGISITFAGFADLASSSKPLYQAQYGITVIVSSFLTVIGVVVLIATINNNASLLRRLSVFFWISTVFMLILNATSYVIIIAFHKPEAVKKCQNDPNRIVDEDGVKFDLDCDKIVNYLLIQDAFELLVLEIIWIYLTYTIVCYSRKLITKSGILISQPKFSKHGVYVYQIHTTNIPPTSDYLKPQKYLV